MKKMEIWREGNGNCFSGIRLTLSNSEQSPAFKTSSSNQHGPTVLEIDQNARIKSLSMQTGPCTCGGLKLHGGNNKTYEVEGSKDGMWKELEIPRGEDIIGIYGNNRSYPQIVNFGFITVSYKKRPLSEYHVMDRNSVRNADDVDFQSSDADSNYT